MRLSIAPDTAEADDGLTVEAVEAEFPGWHVVSHAPGLLTANRDCGRHGLHVCYHDLQKASTLPELREKIRVYEADHPYQPPGGSQ
jgi:hypothetical protein